MGFPHQHSLYRASTHRRGSQRHSHPAARSLAHEPLQNAAWSPAGRSPSAHLRITGPAWIVIPPAEREAMSEPIKHHLPQRASPSDMPFSSNPPPKPTLLAFVTLQKSNLRAPRPTIRVPQHVPSENPNHSAPRPSSSLSSHLAPFTPHSPLPIHPRASTFHPKPYR